MEIHPFLCRNGRSECFGSEDSIQHQLMNILFFYFAAVSSIPNERNSLVSYVQFQILKIEDLRT